MLGKRLSNRSVFTLGFTLGLTLALPLGLASCDCHETGDAALLLSHAEGSLEKLGSELQGGDFEKATKSCEDLKGSYSKLSGLFKEVAQAFEAFAAAPKYGARYEKETSEIRELLARLRFDSAFLCSLIKLSETSDPDDYPLQLIGQELKEFSARVQNYATECTKPVTDSSNDSPPVTTEETPRPPSDIPASGVSPATPDSPGVAASPSQAPESSRIH